MHHLGVQKYARFRIRQGPRLTGTDAFRVSPAKITFDRFSPNFVKFHRPKGTGRETHSTAHTFLVIDHHSVENVVPIDGLIVTG